jgi:hypothetical protein
LEEALAKKNRDAKDAKKSKKPASGGAVPNVSDLMNTKVAQKPSKAPPPKIAEKNPVKTAKKPPEKPPERMDKMPKGRDPKTPVSAIKKPEMARPVPVKKPANSLPDLPDSFVEKGSVGEGDEDDDGEFEQVIEDDLEDGPDDPGYDLEPDELSGGDLDPDDPDPRSPGARSSYADETLFESAENPGSAIPENEEDVLENYERYSEEENRAPYAREEDQMSDEMDELESAFHAPRATGPIKNPGAPVSHVPGAQKVVTREIPRPMISENPLSNSRQIKIPKGNSVSGLPRTGGVFANQMQSKQNPRNPSQEQGVKQRAAQGALPHEDMQQENDRLKWELYETHKKLTENEKKLNELVAYVSRQRKLSAGIEEQHIASRKPADAEGTPKKPSLFGKLFGGSKKSKVSGKPGKKKPPDKKTVQNPPVPMKPTTIPQKKYAYPVEKGPSRMKRAIIAILGILIFGLGVWLTTSPKVIADIPYVLTMGIVLVALGIDLVLNQL